MDGGPDSLLIFHRPEFFMYHGSIETLQEPGVPGENTEKRPSKIPNPEHRLD